MRLSVARTPVLLRGVLGMVALVALLLGAPTLVLANSGRILLEAGGVTRTAIVVEHERLKRSRRTVVFVLHGAGGNGARIRRALGLDEVGRNTGRIIVYPDAIGGRWEDTPGPAATRDVAFLRDLAAKLVSDGLADRRRIFLIGSSSGGIMALRTACEAADTFAGVAVLVAGMPTELSESCKPSRPLPLLMVLGTADPLVPYKGGRANLPDSKVDLISADATLAFFAKLDGCSDARTTTNVPDRDPHDGTRAYIEKFTGCRMPVELLRVEGGGHSVPSRSSEVRQSGSTGLRNNDIDTARVVSDFFRSLGD